MQVVKKDHTVENFNPVKISIAINKAAGRCDKQIDESNTQRVVDGVLKRVDGRDNVSVL